MAAVVHYKFKNSIDYDSITFDGLAISLADLKKSILLKKRMRAEDTDLQVVNAQTAEEYTSANMMIPKNTSLIIARKPVAGVNKVEITPQTKARKWAAFRKETQASLKEAERGYNTDTLKKSDLVSSQASEMDKIKAMMDQSTRDFDPSNYKYKVPRGTPGASYICYRCGKSGHFIQNCPIPAKDGPPMQDFKIKKPTGIPLDHMLIVTEALPGTYKTHTGQYAVPKIDMVAYAEGKKERPPFMPEVEQKKMVPAKKPVPKELKCPLCGDIAKDAVVIPCCGNSYCDDCIRNKLLETDDHVCPSCDSMDVSPDGLIANQMLRRAVTSFQNETGYSKIAKITAAKMQQDAARAAAQNPVAIVPRGPSVLDYRPPSREEPPPPPPPPKPSPTQDPQYSQPEVTFSTPRAQRQPSVPEPPTPTLDEPVRSTGQQHSSPELLPPHSSQGNRSYENSGKQIEALGTVVGMGSNPKPTTERKPQGVFDSLYEAANSSQMAPAPAVSSASFPVPNFPPPAIPSQFSGPPPGMGGPPVIPPPFPPPPGAPPPLMRPDGPGPPVGPQGLLPTPGAPPIPGAPAIPKPLSKEEFIEEKMRLLREEMRALADPLFKETKPKRRSRSPKTRSRTRTRSRSPRPRSRSRSRLRSRSRSRSRSRRRSYSRSLTPLSRRYSPRRSLSPRRRSLSPRRSWTPRRSRSRSRYRSYSRSPGRRRSLSRSRSRSRRRSPFRSPPRRSFSRSPRRRSRSRSRGWYSPPRRSSRSPFRRSLSPARRGFSPARRGRSFSRGRSYSRSPSRKFSPRRSPLRRSPFRKVSPARRNKTSPVRRRSPLRGSPVKKRSPVRGSKEKSLLPKPLPKAKSPKKDLKQVPIKTTAIKPLIQVQTQENRPEPVVNKNKENIPTGANNILISLVESPVAPQVSKSETDIANSKGESIQVVKSIGKHAVGAPIKSLVDDSSVDKTNKDVKPKQKPPVGKEGVKKSESGTSVKDKSNSSKSDTTKKSAKQTDTSEKTKDRSNSKEKTSDSQKSSKPRKKRSPPRRKREEKSESPPRFTEPLLLKRPFDNSDRRDFPRGRGRGFGRRDDFPDNRDSRYQGKGDWDRDNRGRGRSSERQQVQEGFRAADYRTSGSSGFRPNEFRGQQEFRGRNQEFPGRNQEFPGRNQEFPARNQEFPRRNPEFPGRNQEFPARGQEFPPDMNRHGMEFNRDFPPARTSPGFPAAGPGGQLPEFPGPFPGMMVPPRDPRLDPNYMQNQSSDEAIIKFEQYKQMYDMYHRTYGFAPSQTPGGAGPLPSGQTPPQGPPPAPPGTTPLLPTPAMAPVPYSRERGSPPRRHRSRSPLRARSPNKHARSPGRGSDSRRDRRDYDRDRDPRDADRRDRDRRGKEDYSRDRASPDRRRSPDRKHDSDRDRHERDTSRRDSDRRMASPEKKSRDSDEKVSKKDKKIKKKKDKGEVVEKKKKKKKEKLKTKKKGKLGKKAKKVKEESSEEEEEEEAKVTADTDSSEEESQEERVKVKKGRKEKRESTQSNTTEHEETSDGEEQQPAAVARKREESTDNVKEDQETTVSSSVSDVEKDKTDQKSVKSEHMSDTEISQSAALAEKDNTKEKRRSVKRANPESESSDSDGIIETKKPKIEKPPKIEVTEAAPPKKAKKEVKVEEDEEDMDEIPAPEDELLLELPEVSKWEMEDDPYDLSPEPTRVKEKWKPEKQTFLPRSVIEKAEKAFSQKVMKPTSVASAVTVQVPRQKPDTLATKDEKEVKSPPATKRDKEATAAAAANDGKRRVFMGNEQSRETGGGHRKVMSKQNSGNMKVTVSSSQDKRKVSTEGGDLRNKLQGKRQAEKGRDRDRDRDRSVERSRSRSRSRERYVEKKRRDSYKDRRDRDYDRHDHHKSHKSYSRKDSVDESKFVPDYDDSDSEDQESADSSSDSSSEEEVVRKKHKHKKGKHKKEKKQKKEKKKEKKRKKHKMEKERKVKSSVAAR